MLQETSGLSISSDIYPKALEQIYSKLRSSVSDDCSYISTLAVRRQLLLSVLSDKYNWLGMSLNVCVCVCACVCVCVLAIQALACM